MYRKDTGCRRSEMAKGRPHEGVSGLRKGPLGAAVDVHVMITARVEAVEEAFHKNSWRRHTMTRLFGEASNCGLMA